MTDIKQVLVDASIALSKTSSTARIDAEILLSFILNQSRTYLYTHPETTLSNEQILQYDALIKKRQIGVPIAYLTHTREFWSLPLLVNEHTLIPRPETELLVELTLAFLGKRLEATILDLGTGSGAIALALASERPHWKIIACDRSRNSLEIAKQNAARLGINNVQFIYSDWFNKIPALKFNAILSNPPYIATNDPHLLEGDVRFEPQSALVSGIDGLTDICKIAQQSSTYLEQQGFLLLEHGYNQKQAVTEILVQAGYQKIQTWQDYQGNDRISGGWQK